MTDTKFIGLDVHKTSVAAAVLGDNGKLVMRSVLITQADAILAFIHGVRGTVRVTLEEGTHAAWLYDLLKPHVAEVLSFARMQAKPLKSLQLFHWPDHDADLIANIEVRDFISVSRANIGYMHAYKFFVPGCNARGKP